MILALGASNQFVRNGARLYGDTGFHPELAAADCESIDELILNDLGNESIYDEATEKATKRRLKEHDEEVTYYL